MKFLTVVIFTATVAGITGLEVEDSVDKDDHCANQKMDLCNKKVKKAFLQGGKKGLPIQDIYCSSMKELSKCIESQLHSANLCQKSIKLRKYHFIVMAYLRMDKLMSYCPQDMSINFKDKVMARFLLVPEFKNFETFRILAFGEQPANTNDIECAKAHHTTCVRLFTGEQKDQSNLCDGVTKFIDCYQKNECSNPLSTSFAHLIKEMSTELIEAFKANKDLSMCQVDKSEL